MGARAARSWSPSAGRSRSSSAAASHSFSLTDVPLTLALVFASGTHAFVAIFLGSLVALHPAPPAARSSSAFNLAQFAFVTRCC